jgi:hypothetical protein
MLGSVRAFWERVSDGIGIEDLWAQLRADAHASYRFYSQEVDSTRQTGEPQPRRFWRVASGLFWAMIMKLSPGRRVLLLTALVCLALQGPQIRYGTFEIQIPNLSLPGGVAMLVLLALELADRVTLKRDLEIAREIQNWLMPSAPPLVAGVDIAFATRPANTVAGDYYDAFFREDRLLLVVADVAGKSVPAALLMATLQASLRTLAALPGSLVELVGRLNRYACAQNLGGHRFTTAFLAELDPVTGRMTYVNCGHNWPVLRRLSGEVEHLEAGGLPLGILPAAAYEYGETTLGAGDLLIIFTDGLVEAEDEKEQEYGEERFLEVVAGLAAPSAPESLKRLMSSVDAFVGLTRQHDDITCLVLRKLAAPDSPVA